MRKQFVSLFLAAIMAISVCPTISFAAGKGFSKTKTYEDGQFPDVAAADWYAAGVKTAYEYGIMQGTGDGFGAHNTLSIAETVVMAARLHSLYHTGSDSFEAGSPWYQVYVDYALANGILAQPYPDYTKAATRTEFVMILRNALPAEALEGINAVDDGAVPDVSMSAQGAAAIYDFYRAGILTGSDAKGNFQPGSNIDRASVAAIIARMVEPALRQKITLQVPQVTIYAKSGDQTKSVPVTEVESYLAQGYQTTPAAASLGGYFQTYGADDFVPESSGILREYSSQYSSYRLDWAYGDGCLVLSGDKDHKIYYSDLDNITVNAAGVREVYLKRGTELDINYDVAFDRYPAIDRIEIPDTTTGLFNDLCTMDQPLTRVGIPESVTHLYGDTFGGYEIEHDLEKMEFVYYLKNQDLVIYCVPGSAASEFADKYHVRQVAATQVFYPDGRTAMVSSQEKPEYLEKGWCEKPVTLMYNANGNVQAVEVDQIAAYTAQGWYENTADFTALYNDKGETKVAGKNEIAALAQQGWHQDVSGAITTIYAANRKTLQVLKGDVPAYESIGWHHNEDDAKVTLYAADGRTMKAWNDEVEAYKAVGWYETPVVTMYASDGRTQVVPTGEVDKYESVGWYHNADDVKVTLYAADGRTMSVWNDEVETYKAVGWYEVPVVSMRDADGNTQVVAISTALEQDYSYLLRSDCRRIRQNYPSAVINSGAWAPYINSNGELCVATYAQYTIITNFDEDTLHNLTTGKIIVDPISYFRTQLNNASGEKWWNLSDLYQDYLDARLAALNKGLAGKDVRGEYLNS